ncbi:hypothetical protein GvMRE_IIg534 [endosymbiont GvMRE of Glomus versiforme]|nr:hypothetical protein GvMRE_IIg534 [endosymbiont GvMRE of Glomus versiforme]
MVAKECSWGEKLRKLLGLFLVSILIGILVSSLKIVLDQLGSLLGGRKCKNNFWGAMIAFSSMTFIFCLFYWFFSFPPYPFSKAQQRNEKIRNMLLVPVLIMILLISLWRKLVNV